jgi:hypothetical protein
MQLEGLERCPSISSREIQHGGETHSYHSTQDVLNGGWKALLQNNVKPGLSQLAKHNVIDTLMEKLRPRGLAAISSSMGSWHVYLRSYLEASDRAPKHASEVLRHAGRSE